MIFHRRAPAVWVFSVDEDAVQVCWRALAPGTLRLRIADDGVDAEREITVSDGAGAATLDGLPAGRLLSLEASGPATRGEVHTLVVRTLDRLPGEELCRLATVSDLHLGTEVFGQRGTITDPFDHPNPHPLRCAGAALTEARAWGAERIVAKGDLTNRGTAEQWRQYATLVRAVGLPVDAIPGNHDHGPPGSPEALHPSEAAAAFGLTIAQPLLVRDLPGVRLVLADTTRGGRHGGTLAPVVDDIVDAVADADPAGGVLVVLHHQLHPRLLNESVPPGISHRESLAFLDRLGAAHPHVVVTSGHSHRHRRWGRAGVVVTQVGATKDYPGVWAGYRVHEGGLRQIVRRIEAPDAITWTDHSRIAAFGLWEHASPGRLDARCFNVAWSTRLP